MIFVYDLETTGVMHWRNSIHQLAYRIIDPKTGKSALTREINMQPHPQATIVPEALAVSGRTEDDLKGFTPFRDAYKQVIKDLDGFIDRFDPSEKMHLMGYNNRSFDDQFFRAFFKQNGDNYFGSWFWSDSLDVMVLASAYLMDIRADMDNFKLSTVAQTLDIEIDEEKLHDATYDLDLTWQIYEIVTS